MSLLLTAYRVGTVASRSSGTRSAGCIRTASLTAVLTITGDPIGMGIAVLNPSHALEGPHEGKRAEPVGEWS